MSKMISTAKDTATTAERASSKTAPMDGPAGAIETGTGRDGIRGAGAAATLGATGLGAAAFGREMDGAAAAF